MLRATKIIATLGPASEKPEILREMIRAGVDVVRMNFSHGTVADHKARHDLVRSISAEVGKEVGIMADLQGPKIRVGKFIDSKITEDTYKRQLSKVEDEIIAVTKEKDENLLSETQLKEQMLFARQFLLSISNTWKNGTVQRRRLIQRLVFPVGLRCTKDAGVGTLEIPRLLELAGDTMMDESNLVDRVGLEPTTKAL